MFGKFVFNSVGVILLGVLICGFSVNAAESTVRQKNQVGVVTSPDAAVYQSPDFDAEVIDQVSENQKVPMSNKKFDSSAGIGSFYKIKTPKGKIGYIADTDIMSTGKKKKLSEVESEGDMESLYFKKMLGVSVSQVNYTEKFQGRSSSANTSMFGFRLTGPDTLGDNPPLDLNILLGFKPPSYYDAMSSGRSSGFFLLGDFAMLFPLIDWGKSLLNFSLGGMWTYTHFQVPLASKTYASDELRIGIDLGFGGAFRFGDWVIRPDVKYYIEKSQYSGLLLSVQKIY